MNKYLIGDFLKRVKRPINLDNNQEYKLVTIKMNHNGIVLRELKKGSEIKSNMFLVKEGDFILSGIDARNGAFGIIPKELNDAIVTNDFWYFEIDENIILKELFLELTSTKWFDEICKKGSDGTTQRIRLQKDKFFDQEVYLPKTNEQKELLKKIKEFKLKRENLNFEICKSIDLINDLKQSILQEAIRGKLTEEWRIQNPDIDPAMELLKRIQAEKVQLIKEKKIKKEKPLPPIDDNEIPFELPKGWVWSRLGSIFSTTSGGTPTKAISKFWNGNITWYKSGELNDSELINDSSEKITNEGLKESSATLFPKGTLLIAMYGATAGKLAILNREATTNQAVCGFYENKYVDTKYLFYYLFSQRNKMIEESWGMSQPNISQTYLRNFLFCFPSLEEQHVIVKKTEKLLNKSSALQEEMKTMQQQSDLLLKALFNEVFEVKNITKSLDSLFEDVNYNLYVAMIHKQIENRLRINYGEVATQKTVFNINAFTDQKIPYNFINSNHGTFSPQLKDDLGKNIYLIKDKKGNGEVFIVNPSKEKEVLDALSNPKNKQFVRAVNEVLDIYELPFINKETDKIELLNTVAKLIIDYKTSDLDKIYKGMQDWEIKQIGFKTKAEKFSKKDTEKIIGLIEKLGLLDKLKK